MPGLARVIAVLVIGLRLTTAQAPAGGVVPTSTDGPAPATLENYRKHCQPCHLDGKAAVPLISFADGDWRSGSTLKEITRTVTDGVRGSAMVGFRDRLSEAEIADLARYVRSLDPKLK